MNKPLGIILIIGALVLGYLGYTKLDNSKADVKIGDLEISASDGKSKQESYIYFGLAAVALVAGLMISRGKS